MTKQGMKEFPCAHLEAKSQKLGNKNIIFKSSSI